MNIPSSKTSYPSHNYKLSNNTLINQPNRNLITQMNNKITPINNLSNVHSSFKDVRQDQPAFKPSNNSSLNTQVRTNQGSKSCSSFQKTTFLIKDTPSNVHQSLESRKYAEREMPHLVRELDTDQRSSLLTGSTVFNQRYQNVRQFPNYRHRKKGAFERKLKRCGLELDGELTISILRQFLQPFIYRDINSILDDYIKKYFMKAFENIRENINITSENWSKIIKCSISKSLYKQYCTNATINPFDPTSVDLTDFPCFPNLCKVPNPSNQKPSSIPVDIQLKSDIDDSTFPDVASEINSDASIISDQYDINQIDIEEPVNHFHQKTNDSSYSHQESFKHIYRKRNIETEKILVNNLKAPHFNGSTPKFSKKSHPTPSINHCHGSNLFGHSNDISLANHSQIRAQNNYQTQPNNLSEINYDPNLTAPFNIKGFSFPTDTLKLSMLTPSQSAMRPGNYLNLSQNSINASDVSDRYFEST